MKDIENKEDAKRMVDAFYRKVRADALLAPVFAARIAEGQWPAHLERIHAFWNAILFSETGFQGNPMEKHLRLPVAKEHFEQWLALFFQTVDENFRGPRADEAKKRATGIAGLMQFKMESLR